MALGSKYSPCAVIPVYNHGDTAGKVTAALAKYRLPVILVDDGSNEKTKKQLDKIVKKEKKAYLFTLPQNLGKGGAVTHGVLKAYEKGFTHVVQIDADGQHDIKQIELFLKLSRAHPEVLIAGYPVFDDSVPKSRKIGRKITNFWVTIETLSRDIPDSMCGFRMYPLELCYSLLTSKKLSKRMEFDIEIIVRLYWRKVRMIFIPINVIYPEGGISHFRLLSDNLAISRTHAVLFFGMLLRLPILLFRKITGLFHREKTYGTLV